MIIHCIKIPNNDIFNCVSPHVVTNEFFSETFSKSLKKKIWLPNIPSTVLKLVFGEMSSMILGSINASSKKIEGTGFTFKFPKLKKAIEDFSKSIQLKEDDPLCFYWRGKCFFLF